MATIGRALGRSLRIEEIPPDEARRELAGVIPGMLLDAWAAAAGQPAFVTSTVEEITGAPAGPSSNGPSTTHRNFARNRCVTPGSSVRLPPGNIS